MWKKYNPNPANRATGDCTIRALTKALDVDWDTAYAMTAAAGFYRKDMPSINRTWWYVLKENGWRMELIFDRCPDCYTAEDFCRDHPEGTYVLGFDRHTAACRDGVIYDSFDSRNEVPIYYWERRGE